MEDNFRNLTAKVWADLDNPIKRYDFSKVSLKGKFPQTTMWIGWVESTFTNPTVKVWADLDNPFKEKGLCKVVYVALSGWNSARISDITRGQLSIDFVHRFSQFYNFSWISILHLIKFIHKCTHIHLSPNIPKYKRRGKIHFHEK